MPGMPVQQRFGFRKGRKMVDADQTLRGDGTQIAHEKIAVDFERFCGGGIDPDAKARRFSEQSEKNGFICGAERAGFRQREGGFEGIAVFPEYDVLATDDVDQRALVRRRLRKPCFVVAPLGDALQRTLRVTEPRFWAEIGAKGHEELRLLTQPPRAAGAGKSSRTFRDAAIADRVVPA